MKHTLLIFSLGLLVMTSCNKTTSQSTDDKTDTTTVTQGVYFANLVDGEKVKSPVIVQMGVKGMIVEPAGKVDEGKGHHHLIVDGEYIEKGMMVPNDATHIHFGKGQTVDTLSLTPGNHTLTLQFANGVHDSYGKDWSKTIRIEVLDK